MVADLVRRKRCVLSPSVVSCLLVLRFEAVTPTQQGGEGVGRQAAKVRMVVGFTSRGVRGGGIYCVWGGGRGGGCWPCVARRDRFTPTQQEGREWGDRRLR